MAQLSEILTKEKKRVGEKQHREIYLYAEVSFYRAYEWSAWLCVRYISKFNVTKKMVKTIDEPMTFIGFPLTSLEKFTPEGVQVEHRDGNMLVLTLAESFFPDSYDFETQMQTDFENWKQCIPFCL